KDLGSMDVNEVIEKLQQEIRSRSLQHFLLFLISFR
ncbi:hypothetical protein ACR2U6_26325, partial [Klebsiella pneumoniae]